ncbi:MAG: hypothetical protein EOP07_14400, partial [Proteobacteria bacterium]
MRHLNLITAGLIACTVLGCKTYRPTVSIRDKIVEQEPLNSSDSNDVSSLKISGLSLPSGAAKYSRISISVESEGTLTRSIENYKLNEVVPIKPYRTYALTVRVYAAGVMTYSNEYCSSSRTFKSKLGISNYTVPLCEEPAESAVKAKSGDSASSEADTTPMKEVG